MISFFPLSKWLEQVFIVVSAMGFLFLASPFAFGQADRKIFKNSVIPLGDNTTSLNHSIVVNAATDDAHLNDPMDVLFAFSIPEDAKKKLEEKVMKGEIVDAASLKKEYAPKPESVEKLSTWLKEQGFQITKTSTDQSGIYVRGTVKQFEASLAIKMVRVTKNGITWNAAKDAPSLPMAVGTDVQAIVGLQPFRQATKKSRIFHRPLGVVPAVANAPPYLVKEVTKAYGADGLNLTGDGQKIAILIDGFPLEMDTKAFWTKNGIAVQADRVKGINVKGGALPQNDIAEVSMDVQWSSGIASKAKILVYATGTLQFVDLDLGLDRILEDAMNDPELRQLSISLGLGEQFLSPNGDFDGVVAIEHEKFLKLAALGVNVFVSSGDGGSNPDSFGQPGGSIVQTEWMSSSPFVVSVGGTVLKLDGTGNVASESGWPGSGGGASLVFSRPSYQNQPGIPAHAKRTVPDLALLAAPETGGFVFVNGTEQQIGGTSLSAPVCAGFCALMNEARVKANKPRLSFLNPLLYPLAGTNCFRDVQGNSNGAFSAVSGYDMVTGMGAPSIKNILMKLNQ